MSRINVISVNPIGLSGKITELILKCLWKFRGLRIAKALLKK